MRHEDIPVIRMGTSQEVIGIATVQTYDDGEVSITIQTVGSLFYDFLSMGELKSLLLSGQVVNVDPEKAKQYHHQHNDRSISLEM